MKLLYLNWPVLSARKLATSFQTRLLGIFLINTLLTVVIVIAFNQWLRNQLLHEADNSLLVSAGQIADRIDEFHRSNRQTFNVGTKLPDLVQFLQADEEARNDPELRERARITLVSLDIEPWDQYYILSKALLDANGMNIMDTAPANIGADESQQDYFQAALLGGSVNISSIQYRPERGGIYFFYSVPIRLNDTVTEGIIGVLRIQVAIATVQDIVFASVRGQEINATLFDANYVRVVDTRYRKLLFRSITQYSLEEIATLRSEYALPPLSDEEVSVPLPDLVEQLANSDHVQVVSGYIAPDADSQERLAIVRLKTVPWYLVVSQPASQYYAPAQRQTQGILLLTIALTMISLFSSYFIARRVTRPIRALTAAAEQVAEGKLYVKAPIKSQDEVGTLAQAFNVMTTELEAAHSTLEERVERRTQELSEANQKLKHEIAERERYEKRVLDLALEHERRRILSEFIQKASHEFRTPLSIINVKSYLVKRLLPADQQHHLDVIQVQGEHIHELVNRMVLMSRLDSGVQTTAEYLQIDGFMKSVYTGRANAFKEKNAIIHLELQASDTWVYADPDLLSTALYNILDNALMHSPAPVEITIKTRITGETVAIIIEDNGVGIPPELHDRVFERFFRVDEAHTTRGFGLGLPIAKRIIENIGGSIELKSQVGQGTTVTISLSIKSKQESPSDGYRPDSLAASD